MGVSSFSALCREATEPERAEVEADCCNGWDGLQSMLVPRFDKNAQSQPAQVMLSSSRRNPLAGKTREFWEQDEKTE